MIQVHNLQQTSAAAENHSKCVFLQVQEPGEGGGGGALECNMTGSCPFF